MPRLTAGPFRYQTHADSYLDVALKYAHRPVKQAVISPSALSLMYPADEIPGYSREQFIEDLLREHETEVRNCLRKGAWKVQIDFTEGRLAVKIDPSGELLHSFIDLNNLALSRFSAEERRRIGVHTCPGSDRDSTHSGDVDYAALLPSLFELMAGTFYIALAGEQDRVRVLKIIREHMKPDQTMFVGVVDPIDRADRDARGSARPRARGGRIHSASSNWAPATTAGSRRSATTPRRRRETAFAKIPRARRGHAARARGARGPIMAPQHDEEERLRAVALQNAQSILLARRRAEEELRKQSEWLRTTLASIGDAVITTDAEGRVTFMNGVAESLTGWPQADALGRLLPEVFRSSTKGRARPVENPALRALQTGAIVGLANHTILIARDGREQPIDDSAAPIRDDSGATVGAVLVFRDVSEAQERRSSRGAHLAAIVESSHDAIVSKTLHGIVRSWNAGAERLFGYTAQEAIGRPITFLIPPDRQDEEHEILARIARGERVEHFETVRVTKDGRLMDISLTVSRSATRRAQIIGASKIARDITDRKRAEEALREADRQKDQFIALLAHELRNPLAPLRTALQVMQLADGDPAGGQSPRDDGAAAGAHGAAHRRPARHLPDRPEQDGAATRAGALVGCRQQRRGNGPPAH